MQQQQGGQQNVSGMRSSNQPQMINQTMSSSNLGRSSTLQNNPYQTQPVTTTTSSTKSSQNKIYALVLLIISAGLFGYFYSITDDFEYADSCTKLLVASEINEWVWYYNMYIQAYYLILAFGSDKWKCTNFQEDLPKIYTFVNTVVLVCILGMTIALQICLNYQEKCGNLTDEARGYLAIGYIVLIGIIIFLAIQARKNSQNNIYRGSPPLQQQQSTVSNQQNVHDESARLNNNPYANYS